MTAALTKDELVAYLNRVFPQTRGEFIVEAFAKGQATMRLKVQEKHLRPGNTVSGPSMFALADVVMYTAVLSEIGAKALAVTTNCSIDFMRKPEAGVDLIGTARVLKLGRQLAVGDVLIRSDGNEKIVARASLTYAIPPAGSAADVSL